MSNKQKNKQEPPLNVAFNGKAFSIDLIKTRERKNLSMISAAKEAGVPPTCIHDAEAKGTCSLKNLPGICNLIGVPVQYYFTSNNKGNGKKKQA